MKYDFKFVLVFFALLIFVTPLGAQPMVVAHRGASWDAPENTLAACKLAWRQNVKIVEIDILLSKDGHLVVFHDKTTKRFNGKKDKIGDLTLAELKQIDVGSHKGSEWKDERIPTLKEVLATVPADGTLMIELKGGHELLEPLKADLAASSLRTDQIIIIAFNRKLVKAARELMPEKRIHRLLFLPKITGRISAKKMKKHDIDTLSIRHGKGVSKSFVRAMQSNDMQVFVWTVNCPEQAIKLQEAGVDGIITDRPALLAAEMARARGDEKTRQLFEEAHRLR